jgi:hypothetical protein
VSIPFAFRIPLLQPAVEYQEVAGLQVL